MSIRLLQAIFLYGVYTAVDGSTLSLSPALEADLVSQGKAAWVDPPKVRTDLVDHSAAHALIRKGRINELLQWCIPSHVEIMAPGRHAGMTPIVNGALTMSQVATAERPGSAIQLDITGAGTTSAHLLFPTADETAMQSYPINAGGEIHFRMNVSDWSKITSLECYFCQGGGTTNYRRIPLVMANKTQFGATDPVYAAAWNNVWRTLVFDSAEATAGGSPSAWGDSTRYFPVTGLRFICVVSGAVNIKIARVYSAEWPIGVVVPIFDAWYQSAQFYAKRDLLSKGRGCGGSLLSVGGQTKNPVAADVRTLVDNGADVFLHSHGVSGGAVAGLSGSATSDQVNKWFVEHVTAMRQLGLSGGSLWNLFYQNLGQYASGTDMAGILKNIGINASRGDCPDAEFGVNPATSAYMSLGSVQRETWARRRGRFNTRPLAAYTNMVDNNADYDGPPADAAYPTLMGRVAFSALAKTPTVTYFHEIVDAPTAVDNTPRFWKGFIDDLTTKESRGDIVVLSPTELELLTYWRPGDVFLRWDNEWVYRHDPTQIAF